MNFSNTKILFLIWLIPFLFFIVFWGTRKKKDIVKSFLSNKAQGLLLPNFFIKDIWIKNILLISSFFFMILALSGPLFGYKWRTVERKGVDIVVALDCSKSMLAKDIKPNRLKAAKREIIDLINMLQGDRIGLVSFAGLAFLQCPLTLDYEAFDIFLNSLGPSYMPRGGTNLALALETARTAFNEKDNTEKAIILITDGESTEGNIEEIAQEIAKANIKVFTIGVGKKEGVPILDAKGEFKKDANGNIVLTKIDEETLKKIAAITNAFYVRSVAGDMDLDIIYQNEIRKKMKRSKLKSGKEKIWENRFQFPLGIAILLFAMSFISRKPKKNKKLFTFFIIFFLLLMVPTAKATSRSENLRSAFDAYEKKNYETALQKFIDVQINNPENLEIFYNIANCYYKLGDFVNAEKNFQKALKTQKPKLKAKSFYNLGNNSYKKEDYDVAIKNYEESLKINKNDENAKRNIAFIKKLKKEKKKKQCDNPNNKNKDNQKQNKDNQKQNQDNQKQNQKKSDKQNKKNQKERKQNKNEQKNAIAKSKNTEKIEQAKRILERLKDVPGRIEHKRQGVEKDW